MARSLTSFDNRRDTLLVSEKADTLTTDPLAKLAGVGGVTIQGRPGPGVGASTRGLPEYISEYQLSAIGDSNTLRSVGIVWKQFSCT